VITFNLENFHCCLLCYVLVGHGKSSGERVLIDDFQIYVRDVIQHIELLKAKYTDIPLFLWGHSMVRYTVYICNSTQCIIHLGWCCGSTAGNTKARTGQWSCV